jgi:hypothetical protein
MVVKFVMLSSIGCTSHYCVEQAKHHILSRRPTSCAILVGDLNSLILGGKCQTLNND